MPLRHGLLRPRLAPRAPWSRRRLQALDDRQRLAGLVHESTGERAHRLQLQPEKLGGLRGSGKGHRGSGAVSVLGSTEHVGLIGAPLLGDVVRMRDVANGAWFHEPGHQEAT